MFGQFKVFEVTSSTGADVVGDNVDFVVDKGITDAIPVYLSNHLSSVVFPTVDDEVSRWFGEEGHHHQLE